MPPKPPQLSDHDLFRMRLEAMIDGRHELVRLAKLIDWKRFEDAFGALYDENRGRPALPTRLMAGLHLLKHIKGLSDEHVCAQWVENPYFQAFCGEEFFRHELPLDRASMTRWRGRIGPDKLEVLLAETIAVATKTGAVSPREMERVTVDTTVATKAVAHPTDSHLLLRAIEWMNRAANKAGIVLRQSFLRLAGRARREVGRLLHTGGHAQGLRHLRRMRTFARRLGVTSRARRAHTPRAIPGWRWCWNGSAGCSPRSRRIATSSMRCTRPRSSASAKARRGCATSSG